LRQIYALLTSRIESVLLRVSNFIASIISSITTARDLLTARPSAGHWGCRPAPRDREHLLLAAAKVASRDFERR